MTFEEYVLKNVPEEVYRAGRTWTRHLIARQEPWVESTIRPPDFIGRFESLEQDYQRLYQLHGNGDPIPILPHKHESSKKTISHSMSFWTPEMLRVMAPVFEPFANKYGYDYV